jgi:hypothetical protein
MEFLAAEGVFLMLPRNAAHHRRSPMSRLLLVAGLLLVLAAPALANSCPAHMKAIDEALAKNPSLSADQMAEVKQHRQKGEELHKAGKHAESEAELAQAETILGIKK